MFFSGHSITLTIFSSLLLCCVIDNTPAIPGLCSRGDDWPIYGGNFLVQALCKGVFQPLNGSGTNAHQNVFVRHEAASGRLCALVTASAPQEVVDDER